MLNQPEHTAQQELEPLHLVFRLLLQWLGQAEFERADRRKPAYANTDRAAQVTEFHFLERAEHVADIGKNRQTNRFVGLHARHREQQLDVADNAPVAADKVAVGITRAKRALLEAADRIDATGIGVLEERQRLAAVAICHADLAADAEDDRPPDRLQPLAAGLQAPKLDVAARQADFGAGLKQIATAGKVDAVAGVAAETECAAHGIAA